MMDRVLLIVYIVGVLFTLGVMFGRRDGELARRITMRYVLASLIISVLWPATWLFAFGAVLGERR